MKWYNESMLVQPYTTTRFIDLKRENGVVYTPGNLAAYVAQKVIKLSLGDLFDSGLNVQTLGTHLSNFKILDPACGEGELLTSTWHAFYNSLLVENQYGKDVVKDLKASSILCGIDIDEEATSKTADKINQLGTSSIRADHNVLTTNALFPESKKFNVTGVDFLKKYFSAKNGFDVLIANTPWGANTASYEEKLSISKFNLHKGQFYT